MSGSPQIQALCPVFGVCGGCSYQNKDYEEELALKHALIKTLVKDELGVDESIVQSVVSSPKQYHYRHRLDLAFRKIKTGEVFIGFMHPEMRRVVEIDSCPIALEPLSAFIPQLKKGAIERSDGKYRVANLTVRTGDDGRVHWGGMGRKSLKLAEENYFWTEVDGRKIFYSLDTFFQANLSILPKLKQVLIESYSWNSNVLFLDLYGGVGLFSQLLADVIGKSILIEDNPASIRLAEFNKKYHEMDNLEIFEGRVEDHLDKVSKSSDSKIVAMIDPPRKGLSEDALNFMVKQRQFDRLFYLSCEPHALMRDLKGFIKNGWEIDCLIPFDFFPKTRHIETLVVLKLK